jgi:hypothetical protein
MTEEEAWDYCEVVHRGTASMRKGRVLVEWSRRRRCYAITFVGLAIGPHGGRATSPEFAGAVQESAACALLNDSNRTAVNNLIQHLFCAGWEPLPRKGANWYSYRFRRPVHD